MQEKGNSTENENRGKELIITRIFDAPLEIVWRAWTVPEHFMKWWGPKDFTSPVCKIDLRAGGKFLYCMRQKSSGKDFYDTGIYKEIIPNKKLVYTDSLADGNGNKIPASQLGIQDDFPAEMEITVTFEDLNGKTKLTMKQVGMPDGKMKEMADIGWNQSFDKLADSLK